MILLGELWWDEFFGNLLSESIWKEAFFFIGFPSTEVSKTKSDSY